jgi:pantetheine-phosphate adenylyltransferase
MSKRIAIYPGTFDPFTCGHLDIVERAIRLFDEVIVTIAQNSKKKPLFDLEERQEFIRDATNHLPSVRVDNFEGLLINFARQIKATAIIRGLRAISDFEFEFQMALMNRRQDGDITTVFLMANEKYTYLNSSIVKEVAQFGGKIDNLVTAMVAKKLKDKFSK